LPARQRYGAANSRPRPAGQYRDEPRVVVRRARLGRDEHVERRDAVERHGPGQRQALRQREPRAQPGESAGAKRHGDPGESRRTG
jgi:hypothetical protein